MQESNKLTNSDDCMNMNMNIEREIEREGKREDRGREKGEKEGGRDRQTNTDREKKCI